MHRRILALWLVMLSISVVAGAWSSRPLPSATGELIDINVPAPVRQDIIGRTVDLICQGNFDEADELLSTRLTTDESAEEKIAAEQMLQIIQQYREINLKSQQNKEKLFTEKMAELDKIREELDLNDVKVAVSESSSEVIPSFENNTQAEIIAAPSMEDSNDTTDIIDALAAIANVSILADENQKKELLADTFVSDVLQKAIDIAAEYETQGKWLDAYTNCYVWLTVIAPDNKGYEDYSEKLYDKAVIAASLEDSPCETLEDRYEGVDKLIFARAISYLDSYYVDVIDYNEATQLALERCHLLAETFQSADMLMVTLDPAPDLEEKALTVWSTGLDILQDDAKALKTDLKLETFLVIFDRVLRLNQATIKLPESILTAHFAEAALSALDPYTVIVWPKQVENFEKAMTNEFSGIGIEISKPMGFLTVSSLLPDTPAFKSGLDAGDIIEAVDGIDTMDMTLTCAVRKITGPQGTSVKLTIRRPGEEKTREISITRDKIVVPTIRGWQRTEEGSWQFFVDNQNKIGYVRLTSFSGESRDDLEKTLDELEEQGMKGLILDLRFNSGGYLDIAVDIANLFVSEGLIVKRQTSSGKQSIQEWANDETTHSNYPLVILVNSSSASASEIVAGSLADKVHKRAVLVGERTHGKGSVQGITTVIGGGAEMKYTIAYYYLPSNQRVESQDAMEKLGRKDWGVGPNIEVDINSDELSNMLDVQRDNDVLVQTNHNSNGNNNEFTKHSLEETIASDRQLAVGILAMRSLLADRDYLAAETVTTSD